MFVAALIAVPVAAEQALERVRFEDRLGTVPVQVSLCRNGHSSLDTGILGTVYWEKTGAFGIGACLRATDPPEAGGTLTSYADEKFIRTNAQLVSEPDQIAAAYGRKAAAEYRSRFLQIEALLTALVLLGFAAIRPRAPGPEDSRAGWVRALGERTSSSPALRAALVPGLVVVVGVAASAAFAWNSLQTWGGAEPIGEDYPLPAVAGLSFSSPQTREIAAQVQPFIEKNQERLDARARAYQDEAVASFASAVGRAAGRLAPLPGERVVIAEADPQGSQVGTTVRERIYPLLLRALGGADQVALRTISGDITSNGAVAEDGFVADEAESLPEVPVAAVAGDHDSDTTVEQMRKHGMVVTDLETVSVGGIDVAGANDREFKTLFGGSVTNESGISEQELGVLAREAADPDRPVVALFHQPAAAAAYIGVDDLRDLADAADAAGPVDDGIPDLPPGVVSVGHLHHFDGPWIIWNTDTDEVTWTIVDQLGTSGGVENSPTFNRFSTPFSVPLKPIGIRLQYLDEDTGLETGYVTITISTAGAAAISARSDVGAG